MNELTDITDNFHAHLDICQQCRENPFGLCPIGKLLIQRVSHTMPDTLKAIEKIMEKRVEK